jgi:dihydroneopterin aldolase
MPDTANHPENHVRLRGVRFHVTHGALAHEQQIPQPFEVDVDLTVPAGPEPARDRLDHTVDYRVIWTEIAAVMEGPPRRLVETLADDIAARLLKPPVVRVEVTVRKLTPPLPGPVAAAEVTVTRER